MIPHHFEVVRRLRGDTLGTADRIIQDAHGDPIQAIEIARAIVARRIQAGIRDPRALASPVSAVLDAWVRHRVRETGGAATSDFYHFGRDPEVTKLATFLNRWWARDSTSEVTGAHMIRRQRSDCLPSVSNAVVQCWIETLFMEHGQKLYEVSPGLAERLAATELRGITCDMLRLPFRAIYIVVPPRSGLKILNAASGWHDVAGIYVIEDPILSHDREGDGANREPWKMRGWHILAWGAAKSSNEADDAIMHFIVSLPDGRLVSEELAEEARLFFDPVSNVVDGAIPEGQTKAEFLAIYQQEWRSLFEWTMNCVLFSTWPTSAIEETIPDSEARALWERSMKAPKGSSKRRALLDRFKAHPRNQKVIYLGRDIHVLPVGSRVAGVGHPLLWRTLVAGHWHTVLFGVGKQQRRVQWYAPYWKGSESVPVAPSALRKLV